MNKPEGGNRTRHLLSVLGLIAVVTTAIFLLSGCTLKDVMAPVLSFFGREANVEEETAPQMSGDDLLSARVNDSEGRALVKPDGEPVTVMVAYETATGGEPRINSEGILETHPLGEIVTYAPGSPVLREDGSEETYAGGEKVTDIIGFQKRDANGQPATRAAGEVMTHGEDEPVLDALGERMTYQGEPYTYAYGDLKYDTDGEPETYAVMIRENSQGERMTDASGQYLVQGIELMTDESGNPLISPEGEAETKQLDPQPPERELEPVFDEGLYYINNIDSPYVYFSTPEVEAERIAVVVEEGADPEAYRNENGEGTVRNLQLEILGEDLDPIEVRYDAQGYAYFVIPGTDMVLGLGADLRNGVNILPVPIEYVPYPQYKYWDDPMCTVADSQRWIIEQLGDGSCLIRSKLDDRYVMTVDDQYGIHYANIMLWEYDGREQQSFLFSGETPRIPQYVEEGTYFIRSNLSEWMMLSIGDYNYDDGRGIYLYMSDQGDGQMFTVTYDEYGFATIAHNESSKVLSVHEQEARDEQTVYQYESDGGRWQKWIIDVTDQGYYIRSALNVSEVLDVSGGEARQEREILLHWNNDSYAEYWDFLDESIPAPTDFQTMDAYAQQFSSNTDYLILVSSDTNHVGVYEGSKGNWTNIQYWDCVTGKYTTPTLKGEYTVYVKAYSFDGNEDSPAWYTCYYATGWYPAYWFHSIIYYQGTWDIMDASMGYNGSHGCVRLYLDNAKWIYDNIPLDTKVVSY